MSVLRHAGCGHVKRRRVRAHDEVRCLNHRRRKVEKQMKWWLSSCVNNPRWRVKIFQKVYKYRLASRIINVNGMTATRKTHKYRPPSR